MQEIFAKKDSQRMEGARSARKANNLDAWKVREVQDRQGSEA
jgi:hypothetical protein